MIIKGNTLQDPNTTISFLIQYIDFHRLFLKAIFRGPNTEMRRRLNQPSQTQARTDVQGLGGRLFFFFPKDMLHNHVLITQLCLYIGAYLYRNV